MSNDIIAPPIQNMSRSRCYRVNIIHEDFAGAELRAIPKKSEGYVENDLFMEDDLDDSEMMLIEEHGGCFKLTMQIDTAFYGGIIGFKGTQKRRIETETGTEIYVPRQRVGDNAENITIRGKSRNALASARHKINMLVSSLRTRMKATHFVGVALNFGEIREKFAEFKKQVIDANFPGIDESVWVYEECLHLTFVAHVLLNDSECAKAIELLQSCRSFLDNSLRIPFDIKVRGLEIMNDDPSAVKVLYGRVEAPSLQLFANHIKEVFKHNGLTRNDHIGDVKLHMTILNNRYGKEVNPKAPNNFDARGILKQFGDYDFGNVQCNSILLHVLGNADKKNQYYKVATELKL